MYIHTYYIHAYVYADMNVVLVRAPVDREGAAGLAAHHLASLFVVICIVVMFITYAICMIIIFVYSMYD